MLISASSSHAQGWECSNAGIADVCRNSQTTQQAIIFTRAGSAFSRTNATTIATTGGNPGVMLGARSLVDGNGRPIAYTTPDMLFRNTATITTQGGFAHGIQASGLTGSLTIRNEGAISVSGPQSFGILAIYGPESVSNGAAGNSTVAGGRIAVENTARITATGAYGEGITVISGGQFSGSTFITGSDVSVTNSGTVNAATTAINAQSGGVTLP